MVWARFDDGYLENPKVEAAGPLAEHLDMRAIIYCARNETDGRITTTALRRIGMGLTKIDQRVLALVEAGRWTIHPNGGWLIHDFLEFNPSRMQLSERRSKGKERQREWRERNAVTNAVSDTSPRSGRDGNLLEPEKRAISRGELADANCEACEGRGTLYSDRGENLGACKCTKRLRAVSE